MEELRERIQNLNVFKGAVNMHKQYRPDSNNLERFIASWTQEIETLIATHEKQLLEKAIRLTWNKSGEGRNGEYPGTQRIEDEVVKELLTNLSKSIERGE